MTAPNATVPHPGSITTTTGAAATRTSTVLEGGARPTIRREAFGDHWQAIEYIVVSPQLREDVRTAGFALIPPALEHAETEARFDTGSWPLEVRRVRM